MLKGTLVRLIIQETEDEFFLESPELSETIGIVIDSKLDSQWISGHGPYESQISLVSWSTGRIGWVSEASLTVADVLCEGRKN